MNPLTAVLDACVLYPASLRDLLLSLAREGMFRAKWTDRIHDEWIRNVLKDHPGWAEQLRRTREVMNGAILDSLVEGYESLIPSLSLPDPDDRHVLAAAIAARADVIVTNNLRDFPSGELAKYGLEAVPPDEFVRHQIGLEPLAACEAVRKQRARLRKPPKTVEEMFATFSAVGLHKTVEELRRYADRL